MKRVHLPLSRLTQGILADVAGRLPSALAIALGIAQPDPEFSGRKEALRSLQLSVLRRSP